MTSKFILLGLVVLAVIGVVVGVMVLSPEGEKSIPDSGPAAVQNDPADRSVPQVVAWLKEKVKDKDIRIIEWGDVERTETGYKVTVKYVGKNQVGGSAIIHRTVWFDGEGNITRVF